MTFNQIRENIDKKLYDYRDGVFERDFNNDVEEAFGGEFRCLHPDVKSKVHHQAYDRGHASGLHSTLNAYFDLIELTTTMLKTMVN